MPETTKSNRSALILLVLFLSAIPAAGEPGALPVHREHTATPAVRPLSVGFLPEQQTLPGPKLYSLDIPSNYQIDFWISHYSKQENIDWIIRSLTRGAVYRRFILEKIEKFDVPRELIYLPVVESAYFPYAVSRSGAVGLWQFMENSIGPYDIAVNSWMDERRDFWKATEAALHKLKLNYSRLDDWLLGIAAYNCGLGRMRRIVEGKTISDFWTLLEEGTLPRETANFIPKLCAISHICSNKLTYKIPVSWDPGIRWERVPLDQVVDLRILSEKTGISLALLKQGNTELNYSVTPPITSGYFLKIPTVYTEKITKALEEEEKFVDYHIYTIKSGDTLYELGGYYGISSDLLLRYNPGVKPSSLRIGSKLVIPLVRDIPIYQSSSENNSDDPEEERGFSEPYIVREGDSLWSISRRYNTTPELLAEKNSIPLHFPLQVSQKLRVPPRKQNTQDVKIIESERRSGNIPR